MFNRKETYQHISNELLAIAVEDDVISDQESSFIIEVMKEIDHYLALLEKALVDNHISPTEKVSLFKARLDIISRAVKIIKEDATVTMDEKKLFQTLQNIIPQLPGQETNS